MIALLVNALYYLNISVSQKYEVEHPRAMYGDDDNLRLREADLHRNRQISVLLFFVITVVVGVSVFQLIRLGLHSSDHSDDVTSA